MSGSRNNSLIFFALNSDVEGCSIHGSYFHNRNLRLSIPGATLIDTRMFFHENQDRWLTNLEEWHRELSSVASELDTDWWVCKGSRLLANYPSVFENFMIAIAIAELCKSNLLNNATLIGYPDEVLAYLREMGHEVRLPHRFDASGTRRTLRALVRYPRDCARLLFISIKNKLRAIPNIPNAKHIVYSHILGLGRNWQAGDHFFGFMIKDLPGILNSEILWIYFDEATHPYRRIDLETYAQRIGSKVILLHELILPTMALKAIYRATRTWLTVRKIKPKLPTLKFGSYWSHRASRDFYDQFVRFQWPLTEFSIALVFDKVLADSKAKNVIYPYEEKPLERAILASCSKADRHIRTIAIAHAIHNPSLLYLKRSASETRNGPKPTFVATTGELASSALNQWAKIPVSQMVPIGSKRYVKPFRRPDRTLASQKTLSILILVGLEGELPRLADWVESTVDLFDDCQLIIRKYPHAWHEDQDSGIKRLQKLGVSLSVDSSPLDEQINSCDIALFSSTSAGFETMLAGLYTIHCNWSAFLAFEPLVKPLMINSTPHCKEASELRAYLEKLRSISASDLSEAIKKQINFATDVYAPINKKMIASLLCSNDSNKIL